MDCHDLTTVKSRNDELWYEFCNNFLKNSQLSEFLMKFSKNSRPFSKIKTKICKKVIKSQNV